MIHMFAHQIGFPVGGNGADTWRDFTNAEQQDPDADQSSHSECSGLDGDCRHRVCVGGYLLCGQVAAR
ncbi:MAG: hypothetical protein ACI8V4_000878 [Ilumatobacter sp.]|jgi:hypothetical protein